MKRAISVVLFTCFLIVGFVPTASGLLLNSSLVGSLLPQDAFYADVQEPEPWIMAVFFLSLVACEFSFGTLMLYYFGKYRSHDVGIVPLGLDEDDLEQLFEEFMKTT